MNVLDAARHRLAWVFSKFEHSEILKLTEEKPLFGHRSGKQSATHWIAFMKPNV